MSGTLAALKMSFTQLMTNAARNRIRHDFLARGDRFLADIGVSRELLEDGVGAWPWTVDGPPERGLGLVGGSAGGGKSGECADPCNLRKNRNLRAV